MVVLPVLVVVVVVVVVFVAPVAMGFRIIDSGTFASPASWLELCAY